MNKNQGPIFVFGEQNIIGGMLATPLKSSEHNWVRKVTMTYFVRRDGIPIMAIPIHTCGSEQSWRAILSRSGIEHPVKIISDHADDPNLIAQLIMSNVSFIMECTPTTKPIIAILDEFNETKVITMDYMGSELEIITETIGLYLNSDQWMFVPMTRDSNNVVSKLILLYTDVLRQFSRMPIARNSTLIR